MINLGLAGFVLVLALVAEGLSFRERKKRADMLGGNFKISRKETGFRIARPFLAAAVVWFLASLLERG